MKIYAKGQRWISELEPELGLGAVLHAGAGRVQVRFPAAGEVRTYAGDNAPLTRVRFQIGDTIESHEGHSFTITGVKEMGNVIVYLSEGRELPEAHLSDRISLHGPADRLFAARFDDWRDFDLRYRTWNMQYQARRSPVRGFAGARIDLIPHQLYIAQEVASRYAPRVMLSDEAGLGKTIEACLILNRLILTGRAHRILVLVPESLIHQWFVEMLRRFNIRMNIFDEDRCAAIERGQPGSNPFFDDQSIITSINFLVNSKTRAAQVIAGEWDMLVVDEAHHLEWSPEAASPEYQLVEAVSRQADGLLLLTATPEQLGVESHFARLRLLDPDRFPDLQSFLNEPRDYQDTAHVAQKLMDPKPLLEKETTLLNNLLVHTPDLPARLKLIENENETIRRGLLNDLLDMHGPGRVLFRNTRTAMSGFPKRQVHLVRLEPETNAGIWRNKVSREFVVDAGNAPLDTPLALNRDPRVIWLAELLRKLVPEKVLLICRSVRKVEAIDAAIRQLLNVKAGMFHEALSLVQRDRNAAWFAEDEGSRLLICSEIGSEGRNFQFAHHLVLFDLPLNPELLEQRIGRLDRIGQTADVHIHVPYLARSPQEVLVRWYHEGLNAFETNLEGSNALLEQFGQSVYDLALEFTAAGCDAAEIELKDLVQRTTKARKELRRILEQGRDRLLEMNSFRPSAAQAVIKAIRTEDERKDLEEYLLSVFDRFGVQVEDIAPYTWKLNPQGIITDSFPSIPEEGLVVTCNRSRALSREDIQFLTRDHPMVAGVLDLLLGSETGNCAFGVLPSSQERMLLLETVFIVEAIAPPDLHVDRFLPSTPVRIVMNHNLADVTDEFPSQAFAALKNESPFRLTSSPDISRKSLQAMIQAAHEAAEQMRKQIVDSSLVSMHQLLGHEVSRLMTLRQVNNHVRFEEIERARSQQSKLSDVIAKARLRLDAIRLIWNGPVNGE